VDGVFFGAADLAASYGRLGESNHPEITALIEAGLRTVAAGGKAGGVLCGDRALNARYRAAGARFIAVGVDSMLLAAATSALCAEYKPELGGGQLRDSY
jgi:4-hydroxy-2-oxoheptanedioate aldolase